MQNSTKKTLYFLIILFTAIEYIRATVINDPLRLAVPDPGDFNIVMTGFIKMDAFVDLHQVVTSDDGDSVLYPQPKLFDPVGRNINNYGEFNILDLETRLRIYIDGPAIWGTQQTRAAIEADYVGRNGIVDIYRLRHAFALADWENFSLLTGQYWHPMVAEECQPDQLAADGGNPMAVESRAPQIRFILHGKTFSAMLTAASELIFPSPGPIGFDTRYSRDSMTPNFNFRCEADWPSYNFREDINGAGFSIDYKRLRPRIQSNTGYKVNEILSSTAATIFLTYFHEHLNLKLAINVGENMANLSSLSGYAVHSIEPITDERTYVNTRAVGAWGEVIYTRDHIEPAIFAGWIKNLGATKTVIPQITLPDGTIEPLIYGQPLSEQIDTVWRVAPRFRIYYKPYVVGFEIEHTVAGYGVIQPKATVIPTMPNSNTRFLLTFYYYF